MVGLKLVINDGKTGRSYPKNLDVDLSGNKIGDKVQGEIFGLKGYELQITGGSDDAGFPMRSDIETVGRKRALLGSGVGVTRKRIVRKGEKIRTTVRGNTIGAHTTQLNLKIIKYGSDSLEKDLGIEKKEEVNQKESSQEIKSEGSK
ncbi:MAG: S6e family ribosomal protein [Nanoarchaeota archaeon]